MAPGLSSYLEKLFLVLGLYDEQTDLGKTRAQIKSFRVYLRGKPLKNYSCEHLVHSISTWNLSPLWVIACGKGLHLDGITWQSKLHILWARKKIEKNGWWSSTILGHTPKDLTISHKAILPKGFNIFSCCATLGNKWTFESHSTFKLQQWCF
jgi:hypothetical protein